MDTVDTWPKTLPEREAFIAKAIIEGEACIDRLAQMVGTDDFTSPAAEMMRKFEYATRDGEADEKEWADVVKAAEAVLRA